MRLPAKESELGEFAHGIIRVCSQDGDRRRGFLSRLTNNYLTGTDGLEAARHNILQEKIKESSADLYAEEMARLSIELPQRHGDEFLEQEEAVGEEAERLMHNSHAGKEVAIAVEWSHVWPATVLKVFVDRGEVEVCMVPNTGDIGLLRPEVRKWSEQEAVCHSYTMDLSAFERMVRPNPDYRELMSVALGQASPPESGRDAMPAAFRAVVLAQWTPTMIGAPSSGALGQSGLELAMAEPQSREPVVRLRELWVWDDAIDDYRVITLLADSDLIVHHFPNPLVPKDHPFFPVILDPLPFSAWSVPMMVGILKLQMMHEDFLAWICHVLGLQFDPPIVATGVSGILEEKLEALRSAGGDFTNPLPQGDVKRFAPDMPQDGMPMLEMVSTLISRRLGRPPAMTGEGPSRSGDQTMDRALLSSSATLNRAMSVQGAVEAVMTYAMRLHHRVASDGRGQGLVLRTPSDGSEFLLNQFPEDFVVKVDAHSTSPIYAAHNRENIFFLVKEKGMALDDAIQMLGVPQMDRMRRKARRLAKAQAEMAQRRMAIEETKAKAKMESAKK